MVYNYRAESKIRRAEAKNTSALVCYSAAEAKKTREEGKSALERLSILRKKGGSASKKILKSDKLRSVPTLHKGFSCGDTASTKCNFINEVKGG